MTSEIILPNIFILYVSELKPGEGEEFAWWLNRKTVAWAVVIPCYSQKSLTALSLRVGGFSWIIVFHRKGGNTASWIAWPPALRGDWSSLGSCTSSSWVLCQKVLHLKDITSEGTIVLSSAVYAFVIISTLKNIFNSVKLTEVARLNPIKGLTKIKLAFH